MRDKSSSLLNEMNTFLRRAASDGPSDSRSFSVFWWRAKESVDGSSGGEGALSDARNESSATEISALPRGMALWNRNVNQKITQIIMEGGPGSFFYHHTPKEVAMALTHVTHGLISQISPEDLVSEQFGRGSVEEKTLRYPSYMRAVRSFNDRVKWIQAVILSNGNSSYPGRRTMNITFFIEVGIECLRLANFQTTLEITSALSAPCINLVSNNMAVVSEKARQQLHRMKSIVAQDNNYHEYRAAYKSCCIRSHVPLLPVITQDLMRIENGSRSFHQQQETHKREKFNKVYEKMRPSRSAAALHCERKACACCFPSCGQRR